MNPVKSTPLTVHNQLRIAQRLIIGCLLLFVLLVAGLLLFVEVDEKVLGDGLVRASRDTRIYAPVDGLIASVAVESGEEVSEGDPLLQLDATLAREELLSSQAALREAEARLELQKARWARVKKLPLPQEFWSVENEISDAEDRLGLALREVTRYARLASGGGGSKQDYDRALLERELAQSRLDRAREKRRILAEGYQDTVLAEALAEFDTAAASVEKLETEVEIAESRLARLTVRAPRAGKVTMVDKSRPGELVRKGEDLLHLSHGPSERVDVYLPETQIHRVTAGQDVIMKANSFDWLRNGLIRGRVREVSLEPYENDAGENLGYIAVVEVTDSPVALALGSTVQAEIILDRVPIWHLLLPESIR